mgnify:FL=1
MRRYAEAHGLTLDEVIDDYLKCANEFEQQDPLFDQKDPLFDQAAIFIRNYERASVFMLQQKFSIESDRAITLFGQLVESKYLKRCSMKEYRVLQERYKQ